jgi:hypothetical protein
MFDPKGISTLENAKMLIGMVEVEGTPPPMLKPRLSPPPEEDPNVGIRMDGMGVGMLGKLKDRKVDTIGAPRSRDL